MFVLLSKGLLRKPGGEWRLKSGNKGRETRESECQNTSTVNKHDWNWHLKNLSVSFTHTHAYRNLETFWKPQQGCNDESYSHTLSIFFQLFDSPTALMDIHFIITIPFEAPPKMSTIYFFQSLGGRVANVFVLHPALSEHRQLTQITKAGVTPQCVMSPACRPNNCHKL